MKDKGTGRISRWIKESVREAFSILKSLRFVAVIMALLILVYFLGLVIPQKMLFQSRTEYVQWLEVSWLNRALDRIGFTDIYLSPVTVFLLVLFFTSLLVVIVNRIPVVLRKCYIAGSWPSFRVGDVASREGTRVIETPGEGSEAAERLKAFFRKRRWHVIEGREKNTLTALRNRFSPLGFLLFHISFFFCLLGALLISYTRFSASLALTEGQVFDSDMRQFFNIRHTPKIFRQLPSFGLEVMKIHPRYENDVPVELVIDARVRYWEESNNKVIRINDPLKLGALSIIAKTVGVSPLFVVIDSYGRVADSVYVTLNVLQGKEDSFRLDLGGMHTFRTLFFPDYTVRDGVETTASIEVRNPVMRLTVINEQNGRQEFEGTVRLHDFIRIGKFAVGFEGLRYWVEFSVVREYGRIPLIAGFILAAAGLVMRLVFYQKTVRLAIAVERGKTVLYVDGTSEYFRHAFREELERITDDLKRELGEPFSSGSADV